MVCSVYFRNLLKEAGGGGGGQMLKYQNYKRGKYKPCNDVLKNPGGGGGGQKQLPPPPPPEMNPSVCMVTVCAYGIDRMVCSV